MTQELLEAKLESKSSRLVWHIVDPLLTYKHPDEKISDVKEQVSLHQFSKHSAVLQTERDKAPNAYDTLLSRELSLPALYRFANLCYDYWQLQLPSKAEIDAAKSAIDNIETELNKFAAGRMLYRCKGEEPHSDDTHYYWATTTESKGTKPETGTFYQCYPSFEPLANNATALIHRFGGKIKDPVLRKKLMELEQAKSRVLHAEKIHQHIRHVSTQLHHSAPWPASQISEYRIAWLMQQQGYFDQIPPGNPHSAAYYFARLAGKIALQQWRGAIGDLPAGFPQAVTALRDAMEQALLAQWRHKITQWQTKQATEIELLTAKIEAYCAGKKSTLSSLLSLEEMVKPLVKQDPEGEKFFQQLTVLLQDQALPVLTASKPTIMALWQEYVNASADMKPARLANLGTYVQGIALVGFQALSQQVFRLQQKGYPAEEKAKKALLECLAKPMSKNEIDDPYRIAVRHTLGKLCQPPKATNEPIWTVDSLTAFVMENIHHWHIYGYTQLAQEQQAFYRRALLEQQTKLDNKISSAARSIVPQLQATKAAVNRALQHVNKPLNLLPVTYVPSGRKSEWLKREEILSDWRRKTSQSLPHDAKASTKLLQDNTQVALSLMKHMSEEVEIQLGEAPCEFAVFVIGSASRGEVSFCSDIDFAVLISQQDLAGTCYFQAFLELLTFKFSTLPTGLLPLETGKLAGQKSGELWIATPEELVQRHCVLPFYSENQTDLDFPVRWPTLAYTSVYNRPAAKALWERYQINLENFFQKCDHDNVPIYQQIEPITLRKLLKKTSVDLALENQATKEEGTATVKRAHLKSAASSISNAVLCYGRYQGITAAASVQDMIMALQKQGSFSPLFLARIASALEELHYWRLRLHWTSLQEEPDPSLQSDTALLWPVPTGTPRGFYLDEIETQRFKEIDTTITQVIHRSLDKFQATIPEFKQPLESKHLSRSSPLTVSNPKSGAQQQATSSSSTTTVITEVTPVTSPSFDPLIAAVGSALEGLEQRARVEEDTMTASTEDRQDLHWLARVIDAYSEALPPTFSPHQAMPASWQSQSRLVQQHWSLRQRLPEFLRSVYLDQLFFPFTAEDQPVVSFPSVLPSTAAPRELSDFKALHQLGRPSGSYHTSQFFEEAVSKSIWIGRCSGRATGTSEASDPSGRYFEEYKEWLALRLYQLMGVKTGNLALSPQIVEHRGGPVIHLMVQDNKDAQPYGRGFVANYRQLVQSKENRHRVATPAGATAPLQGFGTLLAASCLLYDWSCVDAAGQKVKYVVEGDAAGRAIAKTLKIDAHWAFKFLEIDYKPDSRYHPRSRTIQCGKTEQIAFTELTQPDQVEFLQTVRRILQIPDSLFEAIINEAVVPDGLTRAQAERILTELLTRRLQMLEAYLPDLLALARPQGAHSSLNKSEEKSERKKEVSDQLALADSQVSAASIRFFPTLSSLSHVSSSVSSENSTSDSTATLLPDSKLGSPLKSLPVSPTSPSEQPGAPSPIAFSFTRMLSPTSSRSDLSPSPGEMKSPTPNQTPATSPCPGGQGLPAVDALRQQTLALQQAIQTALSNVPAPAGGWDANAAASFTSTVMSAVRKKRLETVFARPEDSGLPQALAKSVQVYFSQHPELQASIHAQPDQCKLLEVALIRGQLGLEVESQPGLTRSS